jgi:glycosyltransferase involved in cell wall biosynthesis
MAMQVGVIIPARNEAGALGRVVAEIPRTFVREIIVVDNGSTDDTASVARRAGARVVPEPIPGYGRACLAGLSALSPSVDVVVFLDGDHSDDATELPRLLAPVAEKQADLVIGSRTAKAEPGSLTLQQRLGNGLACWLIWKCFGVRYTDLGPFRAIRRDALARLEMHDRAFGWTVEMQAKAARLGLRIYEVPVSYRRRIGRSKISGTLSGTIRAGWAIVTTILRVAMQSRARLRGAPCASS